MNSRTFYGRGRPRVSLFATAVTGGDIRRVAMKIYQIQVKKTYLNLNKVMSMKMIVQQQMI